MNAPIRNQTIPGVPGADAREKMAARFAAMKAEDPQLGFPLDAVTEAKRQPGLRMAQVVQIVMEGYLHLRIAPWLRRLITRMLALAPAVAVIYFAGEGRTTELIVLSQVILSLMLSFAVVPLVMFTGDKLKMGQFANPSWMNVSAWVLAAVIAMLNAILLWQTFAG